MSFGIYIAGFLILLGGVLYVAHLMHVPSHWIAGLALIIVGIGVMSAVKATRMKDPS